MASDSEGCQFLVRHFPDDGFPKPDMVVDRGGNPPESVPRGTLRAYDLVRGIPRVEEDGDSLNQELALGESRGPQAQCFAGSRNRRMVARSSGAVRRKRRGSIGKNDAPLEEGRGIPRVPAMSAASLRALKSHERIILVGLRLGYPFPGDVAIVQDRSGHGGLGSPQRVMGSWSCPHDLEAGRNGHPYVSYSDRSA